jgi:uncharacterized protein (DUF1684 family)
MSAHLELTDWRRRVSRLYDDVRAESDPAQGHALWRAGRDELFRTHPQTALLPDDPLRERGLPYWPYDPAWRFELELVEPTREQRLEVPTEDFTSTLVLIGHVEFPAPVDAVVDVWWLEQYGGGLFLPIRDGSAGRTSYGGGRYALDTAKGADLGGSHSRLVVDLNFLYHPSCRYNPEWVCPLAPPGNTFPAAVTAGERL